MRRARPFSNKEREMIEEAAAAGHSVRQIHDQLAAKGFSRTVDTIRVCTSFADGRARMVRPDPVVETTPEPDAPSDVRFGEMVIRREVRNVSFMTLNGIIRQVPVSLSAGVNWQGAA